MANDFSYFEKGKRRLCSRRLLSRIKLSKDSKRLVIKSMICDMSRHDNVTHMSYYIYTNTYLY